MTDVSKDDNSNDEDDSDNSDNDSNDDGRKVSRFAQSTGNDGTKNSQLAVGFKNDQSRSFVVRGSKIDIFKTDRDNTYALRFSTPINNIKSMEGKLFSPQKIILHNQDQDLLMMKPGDTHQIYKMDLEYGKVTEEWKIHDKIPIDNIIPEKKYSQLSITQTLIGFNESSIYRIDPGVSGNISVTEETYSYATRTQFNCAVTTGNGELAIGSKKGDIRLFDKLNIRAKTLLSGLGDSIKRIDTTENCKFIIATCKNYLLLINTDLPGNNGTTGFTKAMGSNKPHPKRLTIRPEHVALIDIEINFTPARFNTGENEEKAIITTSCRFLIIRDFEKKK